MPYLIGFAPWLAYFVLCAVNHPTRHTLLLAGAVAFALSVILIIPSARHNRVSSVDIGGLIFFPVSMAIIFLLPASTTDRWAVSVSLVALAIAVGVGIAMGRPFTLTYEKQSAPQVTWTSRSFTATCQKLAVGWFLGLVAMTAASVVGALLTPASIQAIIFTWVIPVVIAVFTLRWQLEQLSSARNAHWARIKARLAEAIEPGDPVVGFLDHITTRVNRADAETIFDALRSLGLVEAWKLTDYGSYTSCAVRLGNLNLEIVGSDAKADLPSLQCVTFEPSSLTGLLGELDRRGIKHGAFDTRKSDKSQIYTRIELPELTAPQFAIALCTTFAPVRTELPTAPANDGQVIEVTEVKIATTRDFFANWQALCAPLTPRRRMSFDAGPALTLSQGEVNTITAVMVKVADLRAASKAFAAAGLLVDGTRVSVGTLNLVLTPGS